MANGRRGDTVPLMGLLGQIEKKKNRDVVEVDNLMNSFIQLSQETDSVEGYESAKKNIGNLPEVNAYIKTKKEIALKKIDNDIKSQKVFDDLNTQISSLRSKLKTSSKTHSFEELISDMAFTIGSQKNMISQQESQQLDLLMAGLTDYDKRAREGRILKASEETIGNDPNQISLDPKEQAIYSLIAKTGDSNLAVNYLDRINEQGKRVEAAQNKQAIKRQAVSGSYAGTTKEIYSTYGTNRATLNTNLTNLNNALNRMKQEGKAVEGFVGKLGVENLSGTGKSNFASVDFWKDRTTEAGNIIAKFADQPEIQKRLEKALGDEPYKVDNRWNPKYIEQIISEFDDLKSAGRPEEKTGMFSSKPATRNQYIRSSFAKSVGVKSKDNLEDYDNLTNSIIDVYDNAVQMYRDSQDIVKNLESNPSYYQSNIQLDKIANDPLQGVDLWGDN